MWKEHKVEEEGTRFRSKGELTRGLQGAKCEVCRLIRAKSRVPIIVLSARDRQRDRAIAREVGRDAYLVKPFDYPELAALIEATRALV